MTALKNIYGEKKDCDGWQNNKGFNGTEVYEKDSS